LLSFGLLFVIRHRLILSIIKEGIAYPWIAAVGFQMWRVAANILNKRSWTADKGWLSGLGVEREANIFSP
jgi:hypothetical protein